MAVTIKSLATNVVNSIRDTVIAIDDSYTTRNVLVYPDFVLPPLNWQGRLVLIKYPDVTPYGTAGGAYQQRLDIPLAVFIRMKADVRDKHTNALRILNEDLLVIRKTLMATSATSNLNIYLYDDGQVISPQRVTIGGETVADVYWTACRFWGMGASGVLTWKTS